MAWNAKSPDGARVAIVGSRGFPGRAAVAAYVQDLPAGTVVVSGGARGVDLWAETAATARGLDTLIFHADWRRYGAAAGPLRNAEIAAHADRMAAFWDGASRGTLNAIVNAHERGAPVEVYGVAGEPIPLETALAAAEATGVYDAWRNAKQKRRRKG